MGDELGHGDERSHLLPRALCDRPLRLALSGGGFRATLFSLGSLLYLVDSGEHRRVRSIASVSGASILNGLVLSAGEFCGMSVRDVEGIAAKTLRTITTTGLLGASFMSYGYLVGILAAASLLLLEALFRWPIGLAWWQLVGGIVAVGILAMLRGTLIVRMMSLRFFSERKRPARLGDFETSVTHHLCCTDLNSAERAHFSVGGDRKEPSLTIAGVGTAHVPDFRLDQAVRSSAAFPGGIPPKRIRLSSVGLPWKQLTHRVPPALKLMRKRRTKSLWRRTSDAARRRLSLDVAKALYLTDGGVYNNLATDVDDGPDLVLVIDAGAPLSSAPLRRLAVPALSELGSVARSMSVLYSNTVEPRIEHLQDRASLLLLGSGGPTSEIGFPLIVRITDNVTEGVRRLYDARSNAGRPVQLDHRKAISAALGSVWNPVAKYMRERYGLGPFAADSPDVPTTFGRIAAPVALMLVFHGYLATMFAMGAACGAPVGALDIERFEALLQGTIVDRPGFVADPTVSDTLGGQRPGVL